MIQAEHSDLKQREIVGAKSYLCEKYDCDKITARLKEFCNKKKKKKLSKEVRHKHRTIYLLIYI